MTIELTVRFAEADDEAAWRELWAAYARFTEIEFASEVTATVWRRICDLASPMKALIAVDATGEVLGFLNFVVHDFTFSDRPACVVEDLYVRAEFRGLGIGIRLLSSIVALAHRQGWARVYWVANETNAAARGMFDTYFTKRDGHIRYSIELTKDWAAEPGTAADRRSVPMPGTITETSLRAVG